MKMWHKALQKSGFLCLMCLAACSGDPFGLNRPEARPDANIVAPETITPPSTESEALAIYYRRLQNDLLAQGLLRGDGGGPDTPFTDTILARNFVRIALFDEYRTDGDFLRPQATLSRLRRWDKPIRMTVEFGDQVSPEQRAQDRASVATYADRLARLTGLRISQTDWNPNFHVIFTGEDDRPAFAERIREIVPGIATSSLNAIMNLPRDQLCIVIAFSENEQASYSKAIAVIRAEHPSLLRTSCIHEELAQGLGLANDSPQARPSIFNDDEEFGLLTTHDELLLRMLYDPRLQTGMEPEVAAPIARQIAREYLAAGAS
jgi:hypothetical protein